MCPEKGRGKEGPFRKGQCPGEGCERKEAGQPVLSMCVLVRLTVTKVHTGDSERARWALDPEALSALGLAVRSLL